MLGWLLALTGCTGGDDAGSPRLAASEVRGVTDTEIVLGSYTDLSGPTALWGVGATNGARMRFDQANAEGGVRGRLIRFVVEDIAYQLPKAIQAANKLINRDHIFAMVLAVGTPMNNAIMPQQFAAGVPNLFPISGGRQMLEPFHPMKFTQRGIYYNEVRAAVRHFVENEGKQRVCVIHHDSDYGQEIVEAAEDQLAAMGLQVIARTAHKPAESEFTAAVLRLREAECDMVAMATVHRDTILVLDTARKMGWEDVAWVGNNAAYGQVIADHESGEGYYAFTHMAKIYPDDDKSPAVQAWWDQYLNLYGNEPGLAAMEGYRAADLTLLALENAGRDLTVDALLKGVEAITDYTDIFGYRVSFSPEKHGGVRESVLSQVQDGRFVVLAEAVSY
ncbi:MAG: ABC transporter substrate-binding protein [Gammaproteobacteria bacterium]|nr:ABC transporter substrate-binding protein [Gammaproteobacteria bacterium]